MRIGFELSPITRTRTGVGQYCYYLLKHLLQNDTLNDYCGFSSGMEKPDVAAFAARMPNRHLPVPTRLLYRVWEMTHRPRVDRIIGGADVFHATNFVLPPTATARRVVTIHDITFLAVPEMCSPKITRYFARHLRTYAAEADAVLVHSEATRQDLVQRLSVPAEKIVVAPPGVDPSLRRIEADAARQVLRERYSIEGPFVLFVGTLEPRKNVVGVVRAFAQLRHAADHTLVLIGQRGWNCQPIFETIEALRLTDRVRHLGFLPRHKELAYFYSAAAALAYPTFYEGFGLPLVEAMACGCPVVTSDSSSVPEVVGDAALVAAPEDTEAHARHLDRIIAEPELAEDLRRRGLARAQQFTWDRCAEITLRTYEKVVA